MDKDKIIEVLTMKKSRCETIHTQSFVETQN